MKPKKAKTDWKKKKDWMRLPFHVIARVTSAKQKAERERDAAHRLCAVAIEVCEMLVQSRLRDAETFREIREALDNWTYGKGESQPAIWRIAGVMDAREKRIETEPCSPVSAA